MTKISFFFFAISILFFTSCSNDDDTTEMPEEEAGYFALKVGNSWTYNVYRYNISSMEYEAQDFLVTGTITDTETINGETYYKFESTLIGEGTCDICLNVIGNKSLRDSLGYLIDSNGVPRFTKETTEPYLVRVEQFGEVYGEYDATVNAVETPLGEFENVDYNKSYAILEDGSISAGTEKMYYRDGEGLQVRVISLVSSPDPFYMFALAESTIVEN
tara:strand:- start:4801 stop:5451 length:651 start_codon:yes stop_codon:yes gene_type:complete